MECDVIIYDVIHEPDQVDEACWAMSALHSALDNIDKPKIFILLSTVMTWAKTKPADPVLTFSRWFSRVLSLNYLIFIY